MRKYVACCMDANRFLLSRKLKVSVASKAAPDQNRIGGQVYAAPLLSCPAQPSLVGFRSRSSLVLPTIDESSGGQGGLDQVHD